MTPRQQKAAAIARALRRDFGDDAVVINPLPLDPGQQLRIQILDSKRDAVIEKLCGWGWLPNYLQVHYRVTNQGLIPASIHEVKIEEERPIVPDARKIPVDAAERKKMDDEVKATMKALGRS
jgi:hypothetical protein